MPVEVATEAPANLTSGLRSKFDDVGRLVTVRATICRVEGGGFGFHISSVGR